MNLRNKVRKFNYHICIFLACLIMSTGVHAGVKWTGVKTVVSVQAVNDGGFIIGFDSEVDALCTTATTSRLYIFPDQALVTAEGVKSLLSVALTALSTGMLVDVMYDDTSSYCFGRYILIKK